MIIYASIVILFGYIGPVQKIRIAAIIRKRRYD
jgi:hypothetical protein